MLIFIYKLTIFFAFLPSVIWLPVYSDINFSPSACRIWQISLYYLYQDISFKVVLYWILATARPAGHIHCVPVRGCVEFPQAPARPSIIWWPGQPDPPAVRWPGQRGDGPLLWWQLPDTVPQWWACHSESCGNFYINDKLALQTF